MKEHEQRKNLGNVSGREQKREERNTNREVSIYILLAEARDLISASRKKRDIWLRENENRLTQQTVYRNSLEPTILHALAEERGWKPEETRDLLDWMLPKYDSLLRAIFRRHYAPIHAALSANHAFVRRIIFDGKLENVIGMLKQEIEEGNALHVAINHRYPLTKELISMCKCDLSILERQSSKNDTPLHVAMRAYSEIEGYEAIRNSFKSKRTLVSIHPSQIADAHQSIDRSSCSSPNSPLLGEEGYLNVSHEELARGDHSRHNDFDPESQPNIESESSKTSQETEYESFEIIKLLVKALPSVLGMRAQDNRTPFQELESSMKAKWAEYMEGENTHASNAVHAYAANNEQISLTMGKENSKDFSRFFARDPVASYIKSYCIHNFPRDTITKILYRPGQEKHIEFDLAGLPHTRISKTYLDKLSNHLEFETMLKYVALPRLTVEDTYPVRKQNQRSDQYSNQKKGAKDMKTIFDWLREKGVKIIVKVIVIDDGDTPHSDQAIEESLKGLQVENWDWKKLDISSDVISRSTKKVEEISLYCSGNNAVLMGWGSSDGFPNKAKFPQLKQLNLFIRQGLEDCDYLKRYINDFKKSIEECKRIRLSYRIDDNLISYASDFQNFVEELQHEHEWISHMKSFKTFLKNIEAGRSLQVKVAIIDDGVDASLDILGPNLIASGMTFCPHQNSDFLVNPYFAPSGKHGTQMATLIAKVCPNVRLYIARLNESTRFDRGRRQITAKSAAEAVNWAVECGVDIISMSWTIEGENESIPELEAAIMKAERKDIVMFCSASDQGHNSNAQSCYPGSWMKCIRIGAATSTGEKVTWVPDSQYDFLFPGKNIPFMDNEGKIQSYESGSSLATALAAGLAGTLLFCSRLLIHIEMVDQDDSAYLRGKHKMQKAFGKICQGTNSKWPLVDQYFGSGFKRMLSSNALTENGKAIHSGVSIAKLPWDIVSQTTLFDLLKDLIGDRMKLRKNYSN